MSWLSSFLHPGKGYQKGQEQLDKYFGQTQNYFNQAQGYQLPYFQQGQGSFGPLSGAMNMLLNPEALQNKWASNYAESPAAKNAEAMATEHGLNAASSMGLMGSTPALQAIQAGTSQIGMQDRQNYLDNLMQKYLAGAGIAGNIYNQGANSANQMGNNAMNMGTNAMNMGQNSANMAYGQQNAGGDMFGRLLGPLAGYLGSGLVNKFGGSVFNPTSWTTKGGA